MWASKTSKEAAERKMAAEAREMGMEFSDGMRFNLSGDYRIEERADGWYVVGNGVLIPVEDEEEGKATIERLTAQ